MIGRLRGEIVSKQPPQLLLDVNGVGYEVEAPMSTFYGMPEPGREIVLLTHMVVREDAQLLYGFASETERTLFRALIRINGIGAKLALTILSGISVEAFTQCVNNNDVTTLTRLPGVGKKTAERLIVEMRDKLEQAFAGMPAGIDVSVPPAVESAPAGVEEAVSALVALGYKPAEASRMVSKVADAEERAAEEIIREALRQAVA